MKKVNKRADKPRLNQVISSIRITNGGVRGIPERHTRCKRARVWETIFDKLRIL
jgi:predicted chitinase